MIVSELDKIADDISAVRHAMQDIIDGNDRLDTEPKTRTAIVQALDLLARITEQVRRIDGQGSDGGDYDAPRPSPPVPGEGGAPRTHTTASDKVYEGPTFDSVRTHGTVADVDARPRDADGNLV